VGGMAAAWPYCDAVVSAHNFEALDDLLEALRAPRLHRPSFVPPASTAKEAGGAVGGGSGAADGRAPAGRTAQPAPLSLPITQNLGGRWAGWRSE